MKKIVRKSMFAFTILCLLAQTVDAASIVTPSYPFVFNPGITPAPRVVIPYAPAAIPSISTSAATDALKSMSRADRKAKMSEVKSAVKDFKKSKRSGSEPSTNTLLLVILAILLPPLAVYLHEGVINSKFWIDLILTLLFYLPGMIYALVVVLGKG